MAGSTNSLGSLSSPSPSPSPPPEQTRPAEPTSAGLDSDSELSELTEEESETFGGNSRRGRKKRSSIIPTPIWGWVQPKAAAAEEEEEEEEEEEPSEGPRPMEEEEEAPEVEEEEEEDDPKETSVIPFKDPTPVDDEDEQLPPVKSPSPVPVPSVRVNDTDDELEDVADDEDIVEDPSDDEEPVEPDAVGDNETETDDDNDKVDGPQVALPLLPVEDMDVDPTAPLPEDVRPMVAAAAASSIMAGSQIIRALSPANSSSSGSQSPRSSRSPSPEPEEPEIEEPPKVNPPRSRRKAKKVKAKPVDIEIEIPDISQDAIEDPDADEPNPEDDMEVDADLQPAHRAEALDVLAIIELKFAMLRERVYVEKMQQLAWEETLVGAGSHPELLYIHKELSKRRDKRIELATRKRELEVTSANKRRRIDEDATWSWWKLARDELQLEIIAETNRKRRKLERERRAVERPQPLRRIPNPPLDTPQPPTIRKIVECYPYGSVDQEESPSLVYPELSTLSSTEISQDLDFFFNNRQAPFDLARGGSGGQGQPSMPPPPIGYDSYNDTFPPSGPNRHGLPASGYPLTASTGSLAPQQPAGSAISPFTSYHAGPSRSHVHHHHPSGSAGSSSSGHPFGIDQESSAPSGSGHRSQAWGPGYGHSMPSGRRSISPHMTNGSRVNNDHWAMHMGKAESEEEERREKRERELDLERRERETYHLIQQPHRHGPVVHHGHNNHHHHGRLGPHHHHVVHHHAPPASVGERSNNLSRGASREIENGRHATEIINLSSSAKSHWKGDEYRDKRSSTLVEERDRPLSMPFTMTASHHSPPGPSNGTLSPRGAWNQNPLDEGYRAGGYLGHDSPGGRYNRPGALGLSPPRNRPLPPTSPQLSSVPVGYSNSSKPTARSPTRYRERSPGPPQIKGVHSILPPLGRTSTPIISRQTSPFSRTRPGSPARSPRIANKLGEGM
ncbi:Sds3-like-domain-containing protein [Mycena floridula]|nr:Sds3-like-domain-containing protein [Mycena floridula]